MRPHERVHFADSSRHAAYSEYTDLRFSISISQRRKANLRPSIELMVLARGQVFTFAVLLCESIPIGCDSRCQTFNYLIPTMDSVIEVVANLLRIRGDDFHTRKNRPLPECDSAVAALSQFLVLFPSPVTHQGRSNKSTDSSLGRVNKISAISYGAVIYTRFSRPRNALAYRCSIVSI